MDGKKDSLLLDGKKDYLLLCGKKDSVLLAGNSIGWQEGFFTYTECILQNACVHVSVYVCAYMKVNVCRYVCPCVEKHSCEQNHDSAKRDQSQFSEECFDIVSASFESEQKESDDNVQKVVLFTDMFWEHNFFLRSVSGFLGGVASTSGADFVYACMYVSMHVCEYACM